MPGPLSFGIPQLHITGPVNMNAQSGANAISKAYSATSDFIGNVENQAAADFADIPNVPGEISSGISDAVSHAANNAVSSAISNLWPYLIGGTVLLVLVQRRIK